MFSRVCLATVIVLFAGYRLHAIHGAHQAHAGDAEQVPILNITEIARGVYVSQGLVETASPRNEGQVSNIGFIVGGDAVAVIDTGGSNRVGQALKAAIRRVTELPVRYVINTHMHPDHIFGNAAFDDGDAVFAGHYKLPQALQARGRHYLQSNRALLGEAAFEGTRIVPPARLVHDTLDLDLGGRILRLTAHPTAHTDNDLTVLDLETRTLWLGDLLFDRHIPVVDGSLTGWIKVLDGLRERDFGRVVPGHGRPALPWPAAARPQMHYLTALADGVRHYLREGRTITDATRELLAGEQDNWLLFSEFHARNVTAAFTELEWE